MSDRPEAPSSFESNFLGTVATSLVVGMIGIGSGLIAARFLGPEMRGELAAIQLFPVAFGFLAVLGLPQAIVFFSAKSPQSSRSYAVTAVILALLSSLALAGVGWMALPAILHSQPDRVVEAGRIYLLLILTQSALFLPYHALQGLGRFRLWNLIRFTAPGLWLVVLFGFLAKQDRDPVGIALSYGIGLLLLTVGITGLVGRRLDGPYNFRRGAVGILLRYGAPNMASDVPSTLALRFDQVLIAALLSSQKLGVYVVAVTWSSVFLPLLSAFGAALFPRVAGERDTGKQRELAARAVRTATLLATASLLVILPVTPFVLPLLFGSSYRSSVAPAMILVVAGGFLAFNVAVRDLLRALGKPSGVLIAQLVGAILTVACLIVTLGPFGLNGAAASSVVGYGGSATVLALLTSRATQIPVVELLVPTAADVSQLRARLVRLFRSWRDSSIP